jgi:hypothetical protein
VWSLIYSMERTRDEGKDTGSEAILRWRIKEVEGCDESRYRKTHEDGSS